MKYTTLLFSSCIAMAACSDDADSPLLTSHRYGAIDFGVALAEAEAKLQQTAGPKMEGEGCSYVTFAVYPDIRFMVENGIVTRADAGQTIANATGFSIGANSADLKAANPQIRVEPHKYEPTGSYLILSSFDNKSALVFEENNGLITQVRGGIEPSVQYVEGCG
jgi:hypothetical protein